MPRPRRRLLLALLLLGFTVLPTRAATELHLVAGRNAFQTNETFDLAVVRSGEALNGTAIAIAIAAGTDAARSFDFPAKTGAAVEYFRLDGRLLRPGHYTVTVTSGGETGTIEFDLFSEVRQSTFRLVNWGSRAKKDQHLAQGRDGYGYNLVMQTSRPDQADYLIRAGVDHTSCCALGGGHQMDLRLECDWSDPYVLQSMERRAARWALVHRVQPNSLGVHFYDEPGLTWWKHTTTEEFGPHGVPAQTRSYESAFGQPAPQYHEVDTNDPADIAAWEQWGAWKLGFMEAAWKGIFRATRQVDPGMIGFTQSQYGWSAFTDGYYFNVARGMSVISGHGGYHDLSLGTYMPSLFLEAGLARDRDRDCWYLPLWYGNSPPVTVYVEQYMSFQTGIQGLMTPPPLDPTVNESCREAIRETNAVMARLGTIFTTMRPRRPPLAILYSMSHNLRAQALDRSYNYAHSGRHGQGLSYAYLAAKVLQQPADFVVDEDIVDGTLASDYRAVVLMAVDYLAPAVVDGLQRFIAAGGTVLVTADSKVEIAGAKRLIATPELAGAARLAELRKLLPDAKGEDRKVLMTELLGLQNREAHLVAARPFASSLGQALAEANIPPAFGCNAPGISATVQAEGDIAYTFALNATPDPESDPHLGIKAVSAEIRLPADGRPVYEVPTSQVPPAAFKVQGNELVSTIAFAPGELRVFARTARPIGGIRLATPVVDRSFTRYDAPIQLQLSAALVDEAGGLLSGAAPLQLTVTAPDGSVRYDLYRATRRGLLDLALPLAANDPAGNWTVELTELLSGKTATASFALAAAPGVAATYAGRVPRALYFAADAERIYDTFRDHRQVTIVTGSEPWHAAAAERLQTILKPWGVTASVVSAEEANRPRPISAEAAPTWGGIGHTPRGSIVPDSPDNQPMQTGYAVEGAVILLGTPATNPLTKAIAQLDVLPFALRNGVVPGTGRGYLAWQTGILNVDQDSVCLLASDAEGMAEAIGTLYELVAGLTPLTPSEQPASAR